MNISQAILQRKSIRAFLDQEIDIEVIKKIINIAKYSPSGTNTQPWVVHVVSGDTKKILDNKLTKAFWDNIPRNPDYSYYPDEFPVNFQKRRIECGAMLYNAINVNKEDKTRRLEQWAKNYSSFGAPVTVYIFTEKNINSGSFMDCGMFMQSIMLAALDFGLTTCAQAALAEYPDIVRDVLNIRNDKILLGGIAIGYIDDKALINQYRTTREELDSFAYFYN
jgi:nitroreductase